MQNSKHTESMNYSSSQKHFCTHNNTPGSSATFPTALKAFIKGFFSGSMKSEDFPELSFGPIEGTLIFGNLKHTDAARLSFMFYMLRQE